MNFKNFFPRVFLLILVLCMGSEAFGYVLSGNKWPGATTTMRSTGGNSSATFNNAFVEAMANWNGLSNFVYTNTGSYADPCSDPNNYGPPYASGYAFSDTQCGTPFGSGTLAVNVAWSSNGDIIQAGTVFNSSESWDVHNGDGASRDFKRVATHELGHALGLGHDNTYSALMNTTYSNTVETPQTDDINGLVAIYGGGSGATNLSAPANFTATVAGSRVDLSWSAVSGASGYKLYYGTSSRAYSSTPIEMGNVTSKTYNNLPNGTYYLAIKAYNSSSTSGYSAEAVANIGATQTTLSAPANFTATATGGRVDLSWSAVSGASGYTLYYGTSSGVYALSANLGNITSKTFSNVRSGTYYLALKAYNSSSTSGYSNQVAVTVTDLTAPTLISSVNGNTVTLSWSAVSGASGYTLYYGTASGAYAGFVYLGNITSKTFSNVRSGAYYLAIKAANSSSTSGYSNEVSVSIP